jgi:hypothetical protein
VDDIVIQAMQKWPNVPDCYGWLGLDARGDWYIRDLDTQAVGLFTQAKGDRIAHAKWVEFIARNYAADQHGCWYFQNGPQRIYVELEAAPWVFRSSAGGQTLTSQTGLVTQPKEYVLDERGYLYARTEVGLGLIHSSDVPDLAEQWQHQSVALSEIHTLQIEQRYGFVRSPLARQAALTGGLQASLAR